MPDSNHLSDVDLLRLQLQVERAARLQLQAQMAAQAAQAGRAQLEQLQNELRVAYDLTGADACDQDTGVITRAPRPPAKE